MNCCDSVLCLSRLRLGRTSLVIDILDFEGKQYPCHSFDFNKSLCKQGQGSLVK